MTQTSTGGPGRPGSPGSKAGIVVLLLGGGVLAAIVVGILYVATSMLGDVRVPDGQSWFAGSGSDEADESDGSGATDDRPLYVPAKPDGEYPRTDTTADIVVYEIPETEIRNAPRDADPEAYCTLENSRPDYDEDRNAGGKKKWDTVWLGTPAGMPAKVRKAWEAKQIGGDHYGESHFRTLFDYEYNVLGC